uniref:RING-type domain-containing protein n=1 Tax=Ananas comosus var. bracteatus TaxID=296719 RepID=A0A6V7PE52_ANACO|nr:unnamed protein product [Ananas comosus var. bracteatus]
MNNLRKRVGLESKNCVLCLDMEETIDHLFATCEVTRNLLGCLMTNRKGTNCYTTAYTLWVTILSLHFIFFFVVVVVVVRIRRADVLLALAAALSFSALASSLASDLRLLRSRLALLLFPRPLLPRPLPPPLPPLPLKSLLLARLLLRSLRLLLSSSTSSPSSHPTASASSTSTPRSSHGHVRLLPPPPPTLTPSTGAPPSPPTLSPPPSARRPRRHPWAVLGPYVDLAAKCPRFLEVVACCRKQQRRGEDGGRGEGRGGGSGGAAVGGVQRLRGGRRRRQQRVRGVQGGDGGGWQVCELPCGHRFHWGCALAWLRKRNTCPCCRFELPTEDVFAEIGRLWRAVVRIGVATEPVAAARAGQQGRMMVIRLQRTSTLVMIGINWDVTHQQCGGGPTNGSGRDPSGMGGK